ncbi:MAG: hypothetical protein ABII97_00600 [Patescibacteria group bacterium]
MAERKIHCCECSKFVGIIRDASLRKEIKYVCKECRNRWISLKSFVDLQKVRDLFGGQG